MPTIGESVDFYDPRGRMYRALITNVFGTNCVNVVYVNDVEGQKDNYGQKLLRSTSIVHGKLQQAHGNYWMYPDETRQPVKQPEDSAV